MWPRSAPGQEEARLLSPSLAWTSPPSLLLLSLAAIIVGLCLLLGSPSNVPASVDLYFPVAAGHRGHWQLRRTALPRPRSPAVRGAAPSPASAAAPAAAEEWLGDVALLRTGVAPEDRLEVRLVRGGPRVVGLTGHLALVLRRGGQACSLGFYPYDYRNEGAMYGSLLRPTPGALVLPDPILRKFGSQAESLGEQRVGAALAGLINANLARLHTVNASLALFTANAPHRLPLKEQYAMHGGDQAAAFNCATFVAAFVPNVTCRWRLPIFCRVKAP